MSVLWSVLNRFARRAQPLLIVSIVVSPIAPFISFGPQAAQADVSANDVIFTRQQSAHGNDHIMRLSGSTVTDLSQESTALNAIGLPVNDESPDISPDGSRIVFVGDRPIVNRPDLGDIYVLVLMNSDGSGQQELHIPYYESDETKAPTYTPADSSPRWSPDGHHIVYVKFSSDTRTSGLDGIWSYDTSTNTDTQLTTGNTRFDPVYSPDGTKIAYDVPDDTTGEWQLYIMDADGTNQHLLAGADSGYTDLYPMWSPDGNRIYFSSSQDNGTFYYSSSNGFSTTTVTRNHLNVDGPGGDPRVFGVSKDGSTILYANNVVRTDPSDTRNTCGVERIFSISTSSSGLPETVTDGAGCTVGDHYPSFVQNAWPPTYCNTSTICINAPSAADAPYTRQVTIGLSSTGIQRYEYGWSSSSTTAPNTSYLQTTTDLVNKQGTLNYLGVYSGSGTSWNGGTDPNSNTYLWVRSINTDGSANSWNGGGSNQPLFVHTPKPPVWVGVGDSYSSGHHQDADEPWCPSQDDTTFYLIF
jgi:hypothetical protein